MTRRAGLGDRTRGRRAGTSLLNPHAVAARRAPRGDSRLLVATALAIGIVDFLSARQTTRLLETQILTASTQGLQAQIRSFLDPAVRTLADLEQRAAYGRLRIDRREELGGFLMDRLRYEKTLDQLQYAARNSSLLVAARRNRRTPEAIVPPTGAPTVDPSDANLELVIGDTLSRAARPDVWSIGGDGTRMPVPTMIPVFDVRERPWFEEAIKTRAIVWLDGIRTLDNISIASASIAIRDRETEAVQGVFNTQVFLTSLPAMLRRVTQGQANVQSLLLTRQGELVASAYAIAPTHFAALKGALPGPVGNLPTDAVIPVHFVHDGITYAGGVQGIQITDDVTWFAGMFLPEASLLRSVYKSQRNSLLLALTLLALAVLVATFIATRISRPLQLIARDLLQISQFNLTNAPAPQSFIREVSVVANWSTA